MGSEIKNLVKKQNGINIICGYDQEKCEEGNFPVYNKIEDIKEEIDVIIDFSVPLATFEILKYAKEKGVPTVIATTGFSKKELNVIEETSKEIPIFLSSNMSLEINLMVSLVQKVAETLRESDIEIIETHHKNKIDSPSGTAILLADAINKVFDDEKEYNFERMTKRQKRDKKEIGFCSIRGGNIVGEHTVQFFSENETLEITHKSYSRQVFAEGALKAAEFIVTKKVGLYNMNDLVK